jgi:alanine dehydrogenase
MLAIPRETAAGEARVAATPSAVRSLVQRQVPVLVEQDAGLWSGFSDEDYLRAGAEIVPTPEELYARADWIWKVLRPEGYERRLLRAGQRLYCLMHVGESLPEGVEAVALECWEQDGDAPVRAAMAELAGRLAVQAASVALQKQEGGRGLFVGGVPGVEPAAVLVIGAGTGGRNAAMLAAAMGAAVTVLDTRVHALRALNIPGIKTLPATPHTVERALAGADVVIAAVREGQGAPRVAGRGHLGLMRPGAVVVDLSITDGGAFSTTPRTPLGEPAVVVDGIIHIGVPNFAGSVPRTASPAFSFASLSRLMIDLIKN